MTRLVQSLVGTLAVQAIRYSPFMGAGEKANEEDKMQYIRKYFIIRVSSSEKLPRHLNESGACASTV